MIGAIGSTTIDDIIMFEVSSHKILTFDKFTKQNSVRFAKNDVLLKKPVNQYVGPALDRISFTIILRAQFGVSPEDEMDKLIELQREGETVSILTGTAFHGEGRWVIKELGMPWGIVNNRGRCVSCNVDITFEEYV